MKKLGVFLMLAMVSTFSWAESYEIPKEPKYHFFNDSFWDMNEELELMKEEKKKGMMIMFTMDECPFCHRMKSTVLNQPSIQKFYRNNFKLFEIDIEGDIELINFKGEETTMKDFAWKEYKVRATPVFVFFDENGNYIKRARFTGATNTKKEFKQLGQFVIDKEYKKQSFVKYKRNEK